MELNERFHYAGPLYANDDCECELCLSLESSLCFSPSLVGPSLVRPRSRTNLSDFSIMIQQICVELDLEKEEEEEKEEDQEEDQDNLSFGNMFDNLSPISFRIDESIDVTPE